MMKARTGVSVAALAVVAITVTWTMRNGPPPAVDVEEPDQAPDVAQPDLPEIGFRVGPESVLADVPNVPDADALEAGPDWPLPEGTLISDHPQLFRQVGPVTDEWIERNFVLPYVETDGTACQKLEMPGGEVVCWEEYRFHPYLQYNLDSLQQIADTDAEAAAVLSVMLVDTDQDMSFEYAFKASELSDKMGPLYRFLSRVRLDQTSVDDLLNHYAIARYMEFRGWDRPVAYDYEFALRQQGLTKPEIVAAANEIPVNHFGKAKGGAE